MNDSHPDDAMPDRADRMPVRRGRTRAVLRISLAALVIATFAGLFVEGLLFNGLVLLVLVMAVGTILHRLWNARRNGLELGLIRHPLSRPLRPYLLQCLNRWMFWGMAAITIALCVIPFQFDRAEYRAIWAVIGISLVLLAVLQLVPPRRIGRLGNVVYALGWIFLAVECIRVVAPRSRGAAEVKISPPFRGRWCVMQGGRSTLVNHHYLIAAQSDALDLVMLIDGRPIKGDSTRLDSYAAFGQPLYAPADGRVSRVVNDRPDVAIGATDEEQIVGNHVVIEVGQGVYVMMAHLKKGSIVVSEGEQVRLGQPIAACGNSGNTSEPHLHLQVQNSPIFSENDLATFPIVFRDIELLRWGRRWRGTIGDLRRNDQIIPQPP
jgi:hypothetical protein